MLILCLFLFKTKVTFSNAMFLYETFKLHKTEFDMHLYRRNKIIKKQAEISRELDDKWNWVTNCTTC